MRYVVLADGTRIDNCTDSTTCNEIYALRETEAAAGEVLSLIDADNATAIRVYDASNDELLSTGVDLKLIDEGTIVPSATGGFICVIKTIKKTDIEIMKEEIAELQEAILG